MNKLNSRKLWLCIGACVTAMATAAAGDITWTTAINAVVAAVLGYFTANTVEGFQSK